MLCGTGYLSGRSYGSRPDGEMTGGNGQVAIISGQVANPGLISRQKGFTTEIKESFPGIEIVDIRYSYDDEWVASKIVEEFLELYPELTGIYITGHGVKGVCQTLQKLGKDKTMHVIANDFLEENLKWLKEGRSISLSVRMRLYRDILR